MNYKNRGTIRVLSLRCHALFMGVGVMLVLGVLSIQRAEAQSTFATILGTTTDASGAVVPSTTVTVTNADTQVSRKVETDAAGNYQVPDLLPGNYSITAEHAGFQKAVVNGVVLLVNQTVRYDLRLDVGRVAEQVVVSAAGMAKLQTDDATLGQVVGNTQIEDLPLNGRNFMELVTLGSGAVPVVNAGPGDPVQSDTGRAGLSYSVSGQEVTSMSYLIDGVEAKMNFDMVAAFLPSLDFIQEFKIQENAFSAEFGGAPVVINVATRSGTNRLHGSAFEFVRNNIFDASQIQDPIVNGSRQISPYRQNQFGGSVGGPVFLPHVYDGRNRTFWFFDYEGERIRQFAEEIGEEPTAAELSGNFTALRDANGNVIPIYDPATYNPTTGLRQQFSGNVIPSGRFSPLAVKLEAYLPAPNLPFTNITQPNISQGRDTLENEDQYNVRIDHAISDRTTIFGRYSRFNNPLIDPLGVGVGTVSEENFPITDTNIVFAITHTFSPRTLNELHLGFDKEGFNTVPYNPSGQNITAALGLQNLNPHPEQYGAPSVGGVTFSGFGPDVFDVVSHGQLFQYNDTLTMIRGRHTFKVGGDIRDTRPWTLAEDAAKRGGYSFNGIFTSQLQNSGTAAVADTGSDMADFLLGYAESATGQIGTTYTKFWATNFHVFLLDDLKVNRSLTLSLGFRYEYNEIYHPYDNDIEGFCATCSVNGVPGLLVQTRLGQVRSQVVDPDWRQFGPRVGFAWVPGFARNTVIRGGYGIFYDNTKGDEINMVEFPPDKTAVDVIENTNPTPTFLIDQSFPNLPPGPDTAPFVTDPRDKWPRVDQWNINLQHSFARNWMFQIGYVGSDSRNMNIRYNINEAYPDANPLVPTPVQSRRPFPNYGDLLDSSHAPFAHGNYNGLQTKIEKTFSHGFTLLGAYTYSKCLNLYNADSSADNNQNAHDPAADYGYCGYDIRNRFNVSGVWEIPSQLQGFAGALTKGWQLNSILQMQGGGPLAGPKMSGDYARVGGRYVERLNRVCNGNRIHSVTEWFDTSCFVPSQPGTFGNAGRDVVIGPGYNALDASLFRNFNLMEKTRLQFRWEVFNTLNNGNYNNPNTTHGSSSYGQIRSENAKREMQFSLKFLF